MSMTQAPTEPNPVDDLHTSVTGRIRDALYASEAMLRSRAMRPPKPGPVDDTSPTPVPTSTAAPPADHQAAHLEGLALQARGEADDVTTLNIDEANLGDQDFDQYRQMAATHRATFPAPDPASPARVPAGRVVRPAPAAARRLTARP